MTRHYKLLAGAPPTAGRRSLCKAALAMSVSAAGLLAGTSAAMAEAPPAGFLIGNQAIVTFNDGFETRSVTSNRVQTLINQVYAVDVEADQTKSASVGGLVTFPHTVTNTGNGADIFTLATDAAGNPDFDSVLIYADADCDGVPDTAGSPITATPSLAAGEQFCVVIEADVASGVADGTSSFLRLAATSAGAVTDGGTPEPIGDIADLTNDLPWQDAVDDEIEVTAGPALNLTKSVTFAGGGTGDADSSGSFTPGDTLTFRLTYENMTTNTSAVDAVILDTLPAGLTYVTGTGRWSDTPGVPLTDIVEAGSGDEQTVGPDSINYSVAGGVITAIVDITSGTVSREGYIEFNVTIDSDASGTLFNVGTIDGTPSNQVPIPIAAGDQIELTFADVLPIDGVAPATADGFYDFSESPSGVSYLADTVRDDINPTGFSGQNDNLVAGGDDIVQNTTRVAEGAVITFPNVTLTNHANTAQRFNLSLEDEGGFDPATTFSFYTAGGAPLLDTDGDGNPDILAAANAAVQVQVRADLPLGFTFDSVSGTLVLSASLRAESVSDPSVFDFTVVQQAQDIVGASVDLENQTATNPNNPANDVPEDALDLAHGPNPTNGGEPWTVNGDENILAAAAIDPGSMTSFQLVIENTSLAPDSYNLSVTSIAAGFDGTVVFREGTSPTGAIITNTGLIPAGQSKVVTAWVSVAAGEAPGDYALTFEARSGTNPNVSDSKVDAVRVATVADLVITPDREGQLAAGGSLVLTHTIQNIGNVTVEAAALSFNSGFPSLVEALWLDDGDGELDLALDTLITNISDIPGGLAPGQTVTVFNRVQATSTAVAGLSESAVVQVSDQLTVGGSPVTDRNTANNAVTDIVTIVSGDLEILKRQALDADCNGVPDGGPFGTLQTTQIEADPGNCIYYEVTARNTGTADADRVTIIDSTPLFTTLSHGTGSELPEATGGDGAGFAGTCDAGGPATAPCVTSGLTAGQTGDVTSFHGTLTPGASATLTFSVAIDQ